jgi:hypothetical protein
MRGRLLIRSGADRDSIQLGRSNSDNTVGSFATTFAPGDTVRVGPDQGAGDATFSVRWMDECRSVGESKKQVSFSDVAATEFHLQSGPIPARPHQRAPAVRHPRARSHD